MNDFNQMPKNDMPLDDALFSPTNYINNNSNVKLFFLKSDLLTFKGIQF